MQVLKSEPECEATPQTTNPRAITPLLYHILPCKVSRAASLSSNYTNELMSENEDTLEHTLKD